MTFGSDWGSGRIFKSIALLFDIPGSRSSDVLRNAAAFYKMGQQPRGGFGASAYLSSVWHIRKQFPRSHERCVLFLPVNGDKEVPPRDCVITIIFPLL